MKLGEFRRACENHDWYYMHNSGTKKYLKSRTREKELEEIANKEGGEFKNLFDEKVKERDLNSVHMD